MAKPDKTPPEDTTDYTVGEDIQVKREREFEQMRGKPTGIRAEPMMIRADDLRLREVALDMALKRAEYGDPVHKYLGDAAAIEAYLRTGEAPPQEAQNGAQDSGTDEVVPPFTDPFPDI